MPWASRTTAWFEVSYNCLIYSTNHKCISEACSLVMVVSLSEESGSVLPYCNTTCRPTHLSHYIHCIREVTRSSKTDVGSLFLQLNCNFLAVEQYEVAECADRRKSIPCQFSYHCSKQNRHICGDRQEAVEKMNEVTAKAHTRPRALALAIYRVSSVMIMETCISALAETG